MTYLIIRCLRSVSEWRRKSLERKQQTVVERDIKLTRMIVALNFVFLITTVPMLLYVLIQMIGVTSFNDSLLYANEMTNPIALLCEQLGSAVTIFVYYNMNGRYKSVFLNLFFPSIKRMARDSKTTTKNLTKVKIIKVLLLYRIKFWKNKVGLLQRTLKEAIRIKMVI